MKIFKFIKSHKFYVFGLIFSFCLCFIRPVFTSASNDFSNTIGSYIDGTFVDYPVPDYDLLTISDLLISETDFPISYHYFVNLLDQFSLTSYFVNHTLSDSSYFVDVFYDNSSIVISFSKSLDSFSGYIYSDNFLSFSGSGSFISSISLPIPVSVPKYADSSYAFPTFSSNLGSGLNFSATYSSNLLSYNCLVVGSSYSSNFGSYVDSFLRFNDYKSCSIVFYLDSNFQLSKAFVGLGVFPVNHYPLFNSRPLYSSNINFGQSSIETSNGTFRYAVLPFISDPSSFSFSTRNSGLVLSDKPFVTPTPIPSPEWVSPTPFPTVTLGPLTVTPIPQYINPAVDIDPSDTNGALSGYLNIIDNTFSNFSIFALGSLVLSYFYNFSPYFSFVLLIPAICLIAYAIGRLNQK